MRLDEMNGKLGVAAGIGAAWALASATAGAAAPAICDKPLTGSWETIADITPAGTVVGITEELERRELKATAFFSKSRVQYDGNSCQVQKVTRTPLSDDDRRLFHDPVREKYPVEVSFSCAGEEGVSSFYIGAKCDELVTSWDGAYFLLKPAKRH